MLCFCTCAVTPPPCTSSAASPRRTGHDHPVPVLTDLCPSAARRLPWSVPPSAYCSSSIRASEPPSPSTSRSPLSCLLSLLPAACPTPRLPLQSTRHVYLPGILSCSPSPLVSLLFFLFSLPYRPAVGLLSLCVVAAVLFAVRELRVTHPFIDLRLLGGNVPLLLTYTRALLRGSVSRTRFLYGFTQWLEYSRASAPSEAGLALLPMFALARSSSPLSPVAVPRSAASCWSGRPCRSWPARCCWCCPAQPGGADPRAHAAALRASETEHPRRPELRVLPGRPLLHRAVRLLLLSFFYLCAIASSATNGAFFCALSYTHYLH